MTTAPGTMNLSPVHGGLTAPVNRINAALDLESLSGSAAIAVNEVDETTLYRVADGTLSPLTGPMGSDDYASVLERKAIERDGALWAWTIPVILPVTDEEAAALEPGATALLERDGRAFGTITVDSVYDWDKAAFIQAVYGTDRMDHPGARLWTGDERTKLVGGVIELAESACA